VKTTMACRAWSPSSVPHRVTLPEFLALWTRQSPGRGFYVVQPLRHPCIPCQNIRI
jgi:hypothetical protein